MLKRTYEGQNCSIARALELVGERWTLLIVRDAFLGLRRFDEFRLMIDPVLLGGGKSVFRDDGALRPLRLVDSQVTNTGAILATYGPFASTAAERERELVRLNVEAVVAITRGLVPQMLDRGHGGVINLASQMAFQPMPYFAAYAASKAFVLSFSEALAEELRGTGVRVTAVAPGFVNTEFAEVAGSHDPERRFPHLQPGRVVESALRAHERGRTVKIVGGLYAFLTFAGRFAPRAALRRMLGLVLRPAATLRSVSSKVPPR